MNLNDTLQTARFTVSDINRRFVEGELFIDYDFQRRSVWGERNKIRLIETMLMKYPMPELYFWPQMPDENGKISSSVVDGQQRIRAITEFISGDFSLKKNSLDKNNKEQEWVNLKFDELTQEEKNSIWQYQLNVRTIPSSLSKDEIKKVFLRLNETDKSLNPQEKRNAEFSGLFAVTAEKLAEREFWNEWNIFSPGAIRRMSDVTFVSQLLSFLRLGLQGETTPSGLNSLYDKFNDKYPQRKKDIKVFDRTLKDINRVFNKSSRVANFFNSITHFYPLFIVMLSLRESAENNTLARAAKFDTLVKRLDFT